MVRFIGPHGWPSLLRLRLFLGRSLTVKIMVASAVMVLPLSGGFWYRSLQSEKRQLTASAVDYAGSFAELIRKSVHDEMLNNRREQVQRTISSVTGSESLRAVRIYDRRGVVAFSSNPADIGRAVVRDEQPCLGCHDDPLRPHETLHENLRYTVFTDPDGHRVLSYVEPIYNRPECSTRRLSRPWRRRPGARHLARRIPADPARSPRGAAGSRLLALRGPVLRRPGDHGLFPPLAHRAAAGERARRRRGDGGGGGPRPGRCRWSRRTRSGASRATSTR